MSKTLLNINTSDTFQVWLQRTNDLVNELKTSIVTASLSGDTTVGSAVLTANFSANTVIGRNFVKTNAIDSISVGDTIDVLANIDFTPSSSTGVSITNSSGPKMLYDNNNIKWIAGIRGSTGTGTGSEFVIGPEGTSDYSLRISFGGTLYANTISLDSDSNSSTAAVRADRSITTENGITGGGNLTQNRTLGLTGNPLSLFNLSTNGFVARTASGTVAARTLTEGTGISITNGTGVSGNPAIAVDATVVLTSGTQTIGGAKTFSAAVAFNGDVSVNQDLNFGVNDSLLFNTDVMEIYGGTDNGIFKVKNNIFFDMINTGNFYIRNAALVNRFVFNTLSGDFTADGDVTAYSDARLKTNIRTIDNALDKVTKMRGVYFDKNGIAKTGVIAQEIEEILPEVVNSDEEYKSVAYGNIVGILIEAIKELQAKITELEKRV